MAIRLIARDSNLSILSTKTQHVIRFLSDAKPGEKPSSKVFQFEEGGGMGGGGGGSPFGKREVSKRDRFQQLHSASVRRKRMDSPCRGHIGDLGHGEYFCQRFHLGSRNVTSQPPPPPPRSIAVKMADSIRQTPIPHLHINSLAFRIFLG